MKYPVVDNILPRENNQQLVLDNVSKLIDEAIDFGTNLQKWQLEKNSNSDENIVPILFFRNILSVADGISVLIKNSSIDNAKSLVRVLMESVFSLEYLLQENTKNRALSYFVWNAHRDLKFLEQLNPNTESGKQFKAKIAKDRFAKDTEFKEHPEFVAGKRNAEELLKLPDYIPVEEEYQRTCAKKKNPNWFTLYDGPADFEQLSSKIKLDGFYQLHYRSYSRNIHSTNVHKDVFFPNENGTQYIIQIRYSKDCLAVSVDTINFLIVAFMTVIGKLLPEKNDDYLNWYLDFRDNYRKLQEVSQKQK
jgi:hypothetical protein